MQAVGCVESSDLLVLDDQSLARRIADISDELLYAIVHQRYNLRRAIDQYPGDLAAFSYEPTLAADPGGTMGGGSVG